MTAPFANSFANSTCSNYGTRHSINFTDDDVMMHSFLFAFWAMLQTARAKLIHIPTVDTVLVTHFLGYSFCSEVLTNFCSKCHVNLHCYEQVQRTTAKTWKSDTIAYRELLEGIKAKLQSCDTLSQWLGHEREPGSFPPRPTLPEECRCPRLVRRTNSA